MRPTAYQAGRWLVACVALHLCLGCCAEQFSDQLAATLSRLHSVPSTDSSTSSSSSSSDHLSSPSSRALLKTDGKPKPSAKATSPTSKQAAAERRPNPPSCSTLQEADRDCERIWLASSKVEVDRCNQTEAAGYFVIRPGRLMGVPSEGHSIYRVRMVGPEILLAKMTYCTGNVAIAAYSLTLPGHYSFEFINMYERYSYVLRPQWAVQWFLGVWEADFKFKSLDKCSAGDCPACANANVPGRWVSVAPAKIQDDLTLEWARDVQGLLRNMCLPAHKREQDLHCGKDFFELAESDDRDLDNGRLQWHGYDCRIRPDWMWDREKCLPDRYFCFMGDSHMRHNYDQFIMEFEGAPGLDESKIADYLWIGWADDKPHDHCTDMLVNFGHWPLSYENGDNPWSLTKYTENLERYAEIMNKAKARGANVWWLTSNSASTVWDHHGPAPAKKDWRTDPLLELFNSVATSVMQKAGIEVIDTYGRTSVLNDVSYDAAHYRGYVGRALEVLILDTLCRVRQD